MARRRRTAAALAAASLVVLASASVTAQPSGAGPARPGSAAHGTVRTASDGARARLHPALRRQLDAGSTERIAVFVTLAGDASGALAYLQDAKVAFSNGAGMAVGRIGVQALPKLAGATGVVGVGPVELAQTGRPLGARDPEATTPSPATRDRVLRSLYQQEVPWSAAPPPKGSNFEALKSMNLLDAKTHNFTEAWNLGYTGAGVTVGVLDGGTDFAHPDLLGTWQTWSGLTGARAGWNGWPKAFDPYGTLVWLAAPGMVDRGLTWYTKTTARTCDSWAAKAPQAPCPVQFATRVGPSRSSSAASGTVNHLYQFPAGYTRSGTVRLGSHPDDYMLDLFGERPALLVTDPNTAGVYDTVYVDLDNDHRFDDEKPVTKASPAAYRDMNGDGYADLSGGLLYYISDGATAIPGGLDAFGVVDTSFGPGELLAWSGDFDPAIGGHGTLTASNVVGQGVVNGLAPTFADVPGGTYPGAVIGGAPHAKLTPFGDIYFAFEFSTQFGYFLTTRRGVDVTSNSYGRSDVDNDGWDAASQEADLIHDGRTTTPLFSTGNGAPGFGTVAPPSPSAAISVGASTQFGGTGWDSIARASQIVDNDVMVWSNRGFSATGAPGVDVVADGAYSAGDRTLNSVLEGRTAWETWGGTSRSTPVAAGATALVYQAARQAVNGPLPAGFYRTAKDILKSSARDLGYDATIQGAGSVDAGRAVRTALGQLARVSPNEWRAGSYRGQEYPVFSHLMAPGDSDAQSFTINGPGTWAVADRQLVRTDRETLSVKSANLAKESPYNFNAPDYLLDITSRAAAHPDADLMVVRANFPRAQFDTNGDYAEEQDWRLLTYNWTDVNGDGNLWTDRDGDGVVDHATASTSANPDGFVDLDFTRSEMDEGEYVRLMYHRPKANTLVNFVHDPAGRMADGLFLGLQHSVRSPALPVTDFQIEIEWYTNADWAWVATPATAAGSFTASITVPPGTPYGMYSGAIVLTNGGDDIVVPVAVAVAATATQDGTGRLTSALQLGGPAVAAAQDNLLYNNGSVFGASDWSWRAESGDWRFVFVDVPTAPPPGSLLLTQTSWGGTAPYTDIDTLIMGRSANQFQILPDAVFGAPYVIDTVGSSRNTNVGAGVWRFDTATGGAEDVVAGPAQEGLHAVALHQVGWQQDFRVPFSVNVGSATVSPASVTVDTATDSGGFDVTLTSSLALAGLSADAFGLSRPATTIETAHQDNPDDPSSASVKKSLTLDHAARLRVSTELGDDVDLFVVRDANGDGAFTNDEIVAASASGTGNELVDIARPADGNYQIWVQGYSVAGTPTFPLTVDPVQGRDLAITGLPSGAVPAGAPVTLHVTFTKAMAAGESWFGELLLGPPSAPSVVSVPVRVNRT